jgi:DNA-binding NarL/FixJ family response regulator
VIARPHDRGGAADGDREAEPVTLGPIRGRELGQICAGASGYLLKPSAAEDIADAVRDVQRGAAPINAFIAGKMLEMFARLAEPRSAADDYGLTAREMEILELLVESLPVGQIAERLGVSFHTVDSHTRNIYAKLHVRTRTAAVAKTLKERLI